MSPMGQQRTLTTYRCHVRSWVTSGRGEEVVGTSVLSQKRTLGGRGFEPVATYHSYFARIALARVSILSASSARAVSRSSAA